MSQKLYWGIPFLIFLNMPFYRINNNFDNHSYRFIPWLGILYKKRNIRKYPIKTYIQSSKYKPIIEGVNNPYLLSPHHNSDPNYKISKFATFYAKLLVFLYHHFYFGLYLLSKLSFNLFSNAIEATDVFCTIIGYNQQDILCLPRSIFAATTSKRFKEHGGMFIGIFFPSRHLHAWVIEDNRITWQLDSMWINYTPVSVML